MNNTSKVDHSRVLLSIVGSTVAFAALLDRMTAMDKIAIVRLTARTNSMPRIAALLPQAETFDEDGLQMDPPGFHIIPLPYADDIRRTPLDEMPKGLFLTLPK